MQRAHGGKQGDKVRAGVDRSGRASCSRASGGSPAARLRRASRARADRERLGARAQGLRHFSMKVCEKVEQKGLTTYNEVADELVAEFAVAGTEMVSALDQAYDEKNIRRRVYDALNVLMAMDIITKEKKNILWRGLPTNTEQESARLQMDLNSRGERMDRKRQHLQVCARRTPTDAAMPRVRACPALSPHRVCGSRRHARRAARLTVGVCCAAAAGFGAAAGLFQAVDSTQPRAARQIGRAHV